MNEKYFSNVFFAPQAKQTQTKSENNAKTESSHEGRKAHFLQTLGKHMSVFDQIEAHNLEKRQMLAQMAETFRVESEARSRELMALWLQKDEEKPLDIWGTCLDIARRIMRGEKVTVEEMRLIARHFPELLFQALLLKQPDKDLDENENEAEDEKKFLDNSEKADGISGAGALGE